MQDSFPSLWSESQLNFVKVDIDYWLTRTSDVRMTQSSGCWVTKMHEAVFTGDVTSIGERTGFFSNLGCYTKQGQKKGHCYGCLVKCYMKYYTKLYVMYNT